MKPTHTGTPKNLVTLINNLPCELTPERLAFLEKIANRFMNLELDEDGFFKTEYSDKFILNERNLTNIQPIKPKKETRPFTDEEWKEWFLDMAKTGD